jgi:predicted permease
MSTQYWGILGGFLAVEALAGLLYCARIFFLLAVRRRFKVDLDDQVFYAVVASFGYFALLGARLCWRRAHRGAPRPSRPPS